MRAVRLAGVGVAVAMIWLGFHGTGHADPESFGTAVELRRYADDSLGPEGKRLWKEFKAANRYFAAFSYNAAADQGSYYFDVASLADAVSITDAACKAKTNGGPGTCTLYALVLPKGFPANRSKAVGLSRGMLDNFEKRFLKDHVRGRYSAYAMNRIGNDGWAWDHPTAASAQEGAKLSCESGALRTLAGMAASDRAVARRSGMMACKVVARRGP